MFDASIATIASKIPLPDDKIRCLLVLLLAYPLAIPYLWHPVRKSPTHRSINWAITLKHIYTIICAILLCAFCFPNPWDWFHLALSPFLTYVILRWGIHLKSQKFVPMVWAVVLIHMSYSHIRRQLDDWGSYKFDHTAPLMVMALKLTSAACAIHDYYFSDKLLSPRQRMMAVSLPSPLEFTAYIFFFPGLFVGPAFELVDFRRFISGDMYLHINTGDKHKDDDSMNQGLMTVAVPNPLLPTLRVIVTSIICMVGMVTFADRFSYIQLINSTYLYPTWSISTVFHRFGRLQLAGFAARLQYYAVWKLAEGACILCGLGYNERTQQWDRVTNVRILKLECASSFKGIIDNWNLGTAHWLKHYVYLRLSASGTRTISPWTTVVTYATSAIWHGFYPGYYLTFATGAIITETAKLMRRSLRPHVLSMHSQTIMLLYNMLGWFLTQAILNYVVAPFLLLSLNESWSIWRANWFLGHLGLVVVIFICVILRKSKSSILESNYRFATELGTDLLVPTISVLANDNLSPDSQSEPQSIPEGEQPQYNPDSSQSISPIVTYARSP